MGVRLKTGPAISDGKQEMEMDFDHNEHRAKLERSIKQTNEREQVMAVVGVAEMIFIRMAAAGDPKDGARMVAAAYELAEVLVAERNRRGIK
jgi:histidinol-phosphate/aromatic aminotransferase/cobyric acid decarboxylase-like protein